MTDKQLIEEYEKEIKLLKKEIDTVAIRYYEKQEIDYSFMISLQYLLEKEIIRLKELVKLFNEMNKMKELKKASL